MQRLASSPVKLQQSIAAMLQFEEALQRILAAAPSLAAETTSLGEATGRVLVESVLSPVDLPMFDNSAMDGFAVRSGDLADASKDHPVALQLRGKIAAGESFAGTLKPGECLRLFTGSPLPDGADAVVMQEDTREETSQPDAVWFLEQVRPWENVRLRGEDIRCGTALAAGGDRLTAARIALLGAAGVDKTGVTRRPRVALLANGSELLDAGQQMQPGRIFESNRAMLAALVRQAGGIPDILPLVTDSPEAIRGALTQAVRGNDVVVTSGGISVGEFDLVKSAFEQMGGELEFWKVAIKPGKPFAFGRFNGALLFGLPGNPVSAFVTFLLLVRPALARMLGARETALPAVPGVLTVPLENDGDRRHFIRVFMDRAGNVRSAGAQASHVLGSLAVANGLVDVPPRTALPVGASVSVLRWEFD